MWNILSRTHRTNPPVYAIIKTGNVNDQSQGAPISWKRKQGFSNYTCLFSIIIIGWKQKSETKQISLKRKDGVLLWLDVREPFKNVLADFVRKGGPPPLNGKLQKKFFKKMGQKGLKLAFFWPKIAIF